MIALYKYRIAKNLTQSQLAKILGVVPSTITQYETGARKPDVVMLKKLSYILECTTDELLEPIKIDKENLQNEQFN